MTRGTRKFVIIISILFLLSFIENYFSPFNQLGKVKASPTPPTPLHRWKFEDNLTDTGSYATTYDLTGVNVSYTSSVHANLGNALDLNGSMYAYSNTFLDDITTRFGSTGFTISLWVNTSVMAEGYVAFFYKKLTANDYITLKNYYSVYFEVCIDGTYVHIKSCGYQQNVWHHVVAMMAPNGTMYLYINNVLQGTDSTHTSIPPNANADKTAFYVGYDAGSDRYYRRPVDEIQVFGGLLTDKQREELFWQGVEPVSGQDWILRGNARLVDRTIMHDDDLIFLNVDLDGDGFHEKYEFDNVTLTIQGGIGCGSTDCNSEIKFLDTTVYFNKTDAGFGGDDKWRWINYTNCRFLNVSGTTFKGVSLGYATNLAYVKGLEVRGASYRGIDLICASSPHIEDVYIHHGSGTGIHFNGDNGYFKNITILNMAGDQTITLEGGADGNRFYDLNITDTIGAIPSGGNFFNIIDSNNNYVKNSVMYGWSGATDNPHKAFYFSGTANNNTIENSEIKWCGNGIYSSIIEPYINYVKNVTIRHNETNNADAIDGDKNGTLVIQDSFLYDCVHGLSVEGGVVYRVYNTVIQCRMFEQQTTYDGDIYPVYGTVYLTNSPIQSVAHRNPSGGDVNIYQQWKLSNTNINVTIHTKIWLDETRENLNVTLKTANYANERLTFIVSAPSGTTSITEVYVNDKGKPEGVNGASHWFYESGSQVLTITVLHRSSVTVEVFWGGWTPPNVPYPKPTNSKYQTNQSDFAYVIIGLMAVVLLILFFLRRRIADLYKNVKE